MQTATVGQKTPSYVDCWADKLALYPSKIEVSIEQLQQPGNAFEQFLNRIQANATSEYVLVMVRPGSVKTYRMVRNAIGRRPIDVGYDAVGADFIIDWDSAMRALAEQAPAPPRLVPSPPAPIQVDDPELAAARPAADLEALLFELTERRRQVRDFQATVLEWGPLGEVSSTVSYRAEGNLLRFERSGDVSRGSTFYDGETLWEGRGDLLMKVPTPYGAHLHWVPELAGLLVADEATTVKVTDRWVVVERRTETAVPPSFAEMMKNPEFAKRMAEVDAATAEYAQKHGLPAPPEDLRERLRKFDAERKPPVAQLERVWIGKENGLCYRREWREAESGRILRQWKVMVIVTNIGLTPEHFRPSTAGKQIVDPVHDSAGKFMEAFVAEEMKRVPELRMKPRAIPTTKAPVFFECRNNEVFFVDKDELDRQVAGVLAGLGPETRNGDVSAFLKQIQAKEIGNEDYTVDSKLLLVGIMGLQPRANLRGETAATIGQPDGRFGNVLGHLDRQRHYISFLVRDDSFTVFRKARETADRAGFETGWELLGLDEPIKFGSGGAVAQ